MAESKKSKQYSQDINRFFKRINRVPGPWMQYPTYAGYAPWNDGYKAGYDAGKAKGIQQTEEKFRD